MGCVGGVLIGVVLFFTIRFVHSHMKFKESFFRSTPGSNPDLIVGELLSYLEVNKHFPKLGPFLSIINCQNEVLFRVGDKEQPGLLPGQFVSPHSIAYDSQGNLYVGDVVETDWKQVFGNLKKPKTIRRFQRFKCSGDWPNK